MLILTRRARAKARTLSVEEWQSALQQSPAHAQNDDAEDDADRGELMRMRYASERSKTRKASATAALGSLSKQPASLEMQTQA